MPKSWKVKCPPIDEYVKRVGRERAEARRATKRREQRVKRFGADLVTLDPGKVCEEITKELLIRMPEGWGFVIALAPTTQITIAIEGSVGTNLEPGDAWRLACATLL